MSGAAPVLAGLALLLTGLAVAWAGAVRARPAAESPDGYLRALDQPAPEELDEYRATLAQPLAARLLRPLAGSVAAQLTAVTPRAHLDRLHSALVRSGLRPLIRAEELAALQVVAAGAGLVVGVLLGVLARPPSAQAVLLVVGLPGLGLVGPQVWVDRKVAARQAAILADLPDALDLMAIAVEAGTGFEGALAAVCDDFDTPLGEELSRTLKEMELGLSRREALQNLRRRTEVPELSSFVVAIVQADALGMPVGRVLKVQATEMRSKRRQWAREKAGKLPVKIMFPLVLFIFPAVLVVTLFPALETITRNL